jgi:hypothetical protein
MSVPPVSRRPDPRRRHATFLLLAMLALAAVGLAACGGDSDPDEERATRLCRLCDPRPNPGCVRECRRFCVEDEADCLARCERQCDECRRDLRCTACLGDCTGTATRCAPVDEAVICEDGSYGGPPAP